MYTKYEHWLNEKANTVEVTVSVSYASKAMDVFEDGRWNRRGTMTSSNTYSFNEDDADDFKDSLIQAKIPEDEISIEY